MTMRIKDKTKPKRKDEVDKDFVHWIARQVYHKGIEREGGKKGVTMTPKGIDANCSIYKALIKDALDVLLDNGVISVQDIKIPEGQEALAENV